MRMSDWSSDVCSSDLTATFSDYMKAAGNLADGLLKKEQGDNFYAIIRSVQALQQKFENQGQAFPKAGNKLFSAKLEASRLNHQNTQNLRSEKSRVGKVCVSTFRSRWSPYH